MRRLGDGERGAGGVLAIAICGALVGLTIVVLGALQLVVAEQRAHAAADAAALAAADAIVGRVSGVPCSRADELAALHGASLARCELTAMDAIVTVTVSIGWGEVSSAARAGPPR